MPEPNDSTIERIVQSPSLEGRHLDPRWDLGRLLRAVAHGPLADSEGRGPELEQENPADSDMADLIRRFTDESVLAGVRRPMRLSIAAGLYLAYDFWDLSHTAAQEADDQGEKRFAPYWHGIAHRREPDPGNAAYWFRRVGSHSIFPMLRKQAQPILEPQRSDRLVARMLQDQSWNAYAFIDLCTQAKGEPLRELAQSVQQLEMSMLFDSMLESAFATR